MGRALGRLAIAVGVLLAWGVADGEGEAVAAVSAFWLSFSSFKLFTLVASEERIKSTPAEGSPFASFAKASI